MKFAIAASDDVTMPEERADGILTPVNKDSWFDGQVDKAIIARVGKQYHEQIKRELPRLQNLDTFIAPRTQAHTGRFRDVLFVVDNVTTPLQDVIFAGLVAAEEAHYAVVAMPAMRTGHMQSIYEKDIETTLSGLVEGVKRFDQAYPQSMLDVYLVLHGSKEIVRKMKSVVLNAAKRP